MKLAHTFDIPLRQSYARLGPKAQLKAGRYLHARQGNRAKRQIKMLKTYLGRALRDIGRKIEDREGLWDAFIPEL